MILENISWKEAVEKMIYFRWGKINRLEMKLLSFMILNAADGGMVKMDSKTKESAASVIESSFHSVANSLNRLSKLGAVKPGNPAMYCVSDYEWFPPKHLKLMDVNIRYIYKKL